MPPAAVQGPVTERRLQVVTKITDPKRQMEAFQQLVRTPTRPRGRKTDSIPLSRSAEEERVASGELLSRCERINLREAQRLTRDLVYDKIYFR
jgi:hypothetical protein